MGAVDQAKVGPSKPPHSVSLELLEKNEGAAAEDAGKGISQDEVVGAGAHKRARVDGKITGLDISARRRMGFQWRCE